MPRGNGRSTSPGERGHEDLPGILAPTEPDFCDARPFEAWNRRLAELFASTIRPRFPARLRHVATEVLAGTGTDALFLSVPGMRGRIFMEIFQGRLHVEVRSQATRLAKAFVLTEREAVLIDEGFATSGAGR